MSSMVREGSQPPPSRARQAAAAPRGANARGAGRVWHALTRKRFLPVRQSCSAPLPAGARQRFCATQPDACVCASSIVRVWLHQGQQPWCGPRLTRVYDTRCADARCACRGSWSA